MLEDGCGHSEHEHHFGRPGHGFQNKVLVATIDETGSYLQNLAIKSRNLLKSRIAGASGSAKVHYQSLLIKLNTALKDKI